jgi:hypothetical protein
LKGIGNDRRDVHVSGDGEGDSSDDLASYIETLALRRCCDVLPSGYT